MPRGYTKKYLAPFALAFLMFCVVISKYSPPKDLVYNNFPSVKPPDEIQEHQPLKNKYSPPPPKDFTYNNCSDVKPLDELEEDQNAINKYYPLKADVVQDAVAKLLQGKKPKVEPLSQEYNVSIITHPPTKRCARSLGILILIKTCPQNGAKRERLRQTWANSTYLDQFDVPIEYAFVLGHASFSSEGLNRSFHEEMETNGDFIVGDFVDSYRNNTHKVITALRWSLEHCKDFEHLLMVDDDMYISVHNALRFLRGDRKYRKIGSGNHTGKFKFLLDGNSDFWSAHVQNHSPVVRDKGSKWYVTYDEYPFPNYPLTKLGMLAFYSRSVAQRMFLASAYVKPLSIDDAYLSIVGLKLNISAFHINDYVLFYSKQQHVQERKAAIGIHGIGPRSYYQFWLENDV